MPRSSSWEMQTKEEHVLRQLKDRAVELEDLLDAARAQVRSKALRADSVRRKTWRRVSTQGARQAPCSAADLRGGACVCCCTPEGPP